MITYVYGNNNNSNTKRNIKTKCIEIAKEEILNRYPGFVFSRYEIFFNDTNELLYQVSFIEKEKEFTKRLSFFQKLDRLLGHRKDGYVPEFYTIFIMKKNFTIY